MSVDEEPLLADDEPRQKDRMLASVLAIVLGMFGAHHYYLGSTTAGLLLLVLSCCGVGLVVALVEGVLLLLMPEAEFEAKYNDRRPAPMEFVFQELP